MYQTFQKVLKDLLIKTHLASLLRIIFAFKLFGHFHCLFQFLSLPSTCGRAKLLRTEITPVFISFRHLSSLVSELFFVHTYCNDNFFDEVFWRSFLAKFFDKLFDEFFDKFFDEFFDVLTIFMTNFLTKFLTKFLTNFLTILRIF